MVNSRAKGARGERELASILTDELGVVVKRKLDAAREGGDDMQVGPFSVECKRVAKSGVKVLQWMEQAKGNAKEEQIPIVMFRVDGGEWLTVMRLEDQIPMIRGEL